MYFSIEFSRKLMQSSVEFDSVVGGWNIQILRLKAVNLEESSFPFMNINPLNLMFCQWDKDFDNKKKEDKVILDINFIL